MPIHRVLLVILSLPVYLASAAIPVNADCVTLKSGGEIRGELLPDAKSTGRATQVSIRTLSGAVVTVVADEVDWVLRRRPVVEEYETRRRIVPNTVAGHWALAEWCRLNSLSKERMVHLGQVVQLDAEHAQAHRGLGHVRQNGKWMTRDEQMAGRGYVKHKGRHVLPQELDLIVQGNRVSEAEKAWLRRVKQWQAWLAGDHAGRRTTALARLNEIRDPEALSALARTFRDDPEDDRRRLYVAVLANIEGDQPVAHLAVQSIVDESLAVREAALNAVRRKNVARAIPIYRKALKNPLNLIVNRAATALGQLGDESTIPHLIEALVTRHVYRALVEDDNPQVATGPESHQPPVILGPAVAMSLSGGRSPTVVSAADRESAAFDDELVEVELDKVEENPSVLAALLLLTGRNFGYDAQAWRAWYSARKNAAGPAKP
jgi:hypothetical protein